MPSQLSLFAADRYHDPRVAADRTRRRAMAMLRPVRKPERGSPPPQAADPGANGIMLYLADRRQAAPLPALPVRDGVRRAA